jgi:hypothetical protein
MDDAEFLAEIEKLDQAVATTHENRVRAEPRWAVDFDFDTEEAADPRGHIVLAVLGFALMTMLGAAAAAVVFADRLALILR